jgi:hypothetical protein
MISAPSVTNVALLLALSLFLGLAFEDFFGRTDARRAGGRPPEARRRSFSSRSPASALPSLRAASGSR